MNIRKSLALTIATPMVFSAVISGVLIASFLNAEHQFAQHQKLRKAISACNSFMTDMLQGGTTLAIAMQRTSSPFDATANHYSRQFTNAEHALDTIESLVPSYKTDVDELRNEMHSFEVIAKKLSLCRKRNQGTAIERAS